LRAVEAGRDERLKAQERLGQARTERAEELARKEAALSAFSELDAELRAARRRVNDSNGLVASFRRERDTRITRQAQTHQRREQREAARSRLEQIEAELGAAKTEVEDFTYLAQVFGPDAIQLCEIQAAGPQVSRSSYCGASRGATTVAVSALAPRRHNEATTLTMKVAQITKSESQTGGL